jgi:hypothetical protein
MQSSHLRELWEKLGQEMMKQHETNPYGTGIAEGAKVMTKFMFASPLQL